MSHSHTIVPYSNYVDLFAYDEGICCHPYIDACNASIIFRLLEALRPSSANKKVLDAGSGTGQVVRLLNGIPSLDVEACDIDQKAKDFFHRNPETSDIPYHLWDIVNERFDKYYDAIILRGVYHHIPKSERPKLLHNLCEQSDVVIVADEGILEYHNQAERLFNCSFWYNYVIDEAKRRNLNGLVKMELENLLHEGLNTADDGGDYKESPSDFSRDAEKASVRVCSMDRLGTWKTLKGGFYTAVIRRDEI